MKTKITKKLVDATPCPEEGQLFLRDSEVKGFGVRLTAGGKTFIVEKRIAGQVKRMTIGAYGVLTVDQARDMARELIVRITKGEDPVQAKVDKRNEPTFKDLEDMYIERHIPRKRSGSSDIMAFNKYLTVWHSRKLSSIKRGDVAQLHAQIGKKHQYRANRIVALIGKMFSLAKVWGMYEGDNPTIGIELYREEKRDRFLRQDEMPVFFTSLAEEKDIYLKASILTMLLTGARKSEVLSMQWKDIDMALGTWRIPQTKAGRPHYLPLPKQIRALLASLPIMKDNPYVFVGAKSGGHIVDIKKAWGRIKERAKISDIRVHDLRRTLGSWMAAGGDSLLIIGRTLNHSQLKTTEIYARLQLDPIRAALQANAEKMLSIAAGGMDVLEGIKDTQETAESR